MDERQEKEFGKHKAEKRGWHWALTSFAFEAWNNAEKERIVKSQCNNS